MSIHQYPVAVCHGMCPRGNVHFQGGKATKVSLRHKSHVHFIINLTSERGEKTFPRRAPRSYPTVGKAVVWSAEKFDCNHLSSDSVSVAIIFSVVLVHLGGDRCLFVLKNVKKAVEFSRYHGLPLVYTVLWTFDCRFPRINIVPNVLAQSHVFYS